MTEAHNPPSVTMLAQITNSYTERRTDFHSITEADLPALAELMAIAYKGTIHDVGHTPAQALEYIKEHTDGRLVGPMRWDCSFQALEDGVPVAAILTSEEEPGTPLFFDIYTHPDHRGRGLATGLIHCAMECLRERGFERVRLRVALANTVAHRLYESLGFVAE